MNEEKYSSYREAWTRIGRALDSDFPFEAVTILESMISDRLLSFLVGVGVSPQPTLRSSFFQLIQSWKEVMREREDIEGLELATKVDDWRRARNAVVHGLVKSEPGTPTARVGPFIDEAREAAEEGKRLARAVDNWHKRQLRQFRREASKPE